MKNIRCMFLISLFFMLLCNVKSQNFVFLYSPPLSFGDSIEMVNYAADSYKNVGILENYTSVYGSEFWQPIAGGRQRLQESQRMRVSLGQRGDIDILKRELQEYDGNEKLILVGSSKGAATVVNTIGELAQENSTILNKIAAVVLDSCPANFNDVAREFYCYPFCTLFPKKLFGGGMKYIYFSEYNPNGLQPILSIKNQWNQNVNKDMVIVLIHSKEDTFVRFNQAQDLYRKLYKKGFKNLYFIQSEKGDHAAISGWHIKNLANVMKSLWCIYKKHGIPLPVQLRENLVNIVQEVKAMTPEQVDTICKTLQPTPFMNWFKNLKHNTKQRVFDAMKAMKNRAGNGWAWFRSKVYGSPQESVPSVSTPPLPETTPALVQPLP